MIKPTPIKGEIIRCIIWGIVISLALIWITSCATDEENIAFIWDGIQKEYKTCERAQPPRIVINPNMTCAGMFSHKDYIVYLKETPIEYDVLEQELIKACEGRDWVYRMWDYEREAER